MKRLPEIFQGNEQRKLNRVTSVLEVTGTIIFGSLLGLFIFGKSFNYCEHVLEIQSIQLNGVVTEKFLRSWDRNYHGLKIMDDNGETISLNLTLDLNIGKNGRSILWENISQGDSIIKKSGDLDVRFKNDDQSWKMQKLKYDLTQCKD
ncbi:hypothetical protein [Algoriphagus taiwanensis]|uniref:Uncharacterized protein n=1 Tax=Algoriphagus taiwanensis TaxID=1445656 RepID=A0ABQ6Q271_9BACT|nr:hypothetical protein Ataiwa_13690 [Algoriphagus taiwanensis]